MLSGQSQLAHRQTEEVFQLRDLSELNINERGKPVARPGPTDEQVRGFEQLFAVQLPPDYLHLLSRSNGGHPELSTFVPADAQTGSRWSIDRFYHLGADTESAENLTRATARWRTHLGESAIPIGCDGGDNQICLDLSRGSAVFVCVHDEGFRRIDVAPSLSAFLALLERDPDFV
jgi:hypothetical protein